MKSQPIAKPQAKCPHCGELFGMLKGGMIPTHDFPRPCRAVCPGAGNYPRDPDDERPLWKDSPAQHAKDFVDAARLELKIYGFAVVKEFATLSGEMSGTMACPLCQCPLRFSIAGSNGHCRAVCTSVDCIHAME